MDEIFAVETSFYVFLEKEHLHYGTANDDLFLYSYLNYLNL